MVSAACRYPDSPVFYRKLNKIFPRIVRGEGCYLYDDAGKRYLDACGGAFTANLGHGVREIAEAMGAQARRVAYVNGTAFTHDASEDLAGEIAALCPPGLDKVYFLCSGSEAVEAALKLARQYWVESGKHKKRKIISCFPGYHGNTLLALSASAREHYKIYFKDWLVDMRRIRASYEYRCDCRGQEEDCPSCSGSALEEAIKKEGADSIAAFIAETVGGSSTGASLPRADYWKRIRAICDRRGILWIADEVLAGAGRMGTWSALEPYGAVPDILVLGKGISGGYAPLSAVVAGSKLVDVIAAKSGALLHAQTFSHHPVSCAAGLATVRYLKDRDLIARSARMGRVLHDKLKALVDLDYVGDVRGRGLLAGIEFVEEKAARTPLARNLKMAERFTQIAQDLGLVVWPNVGQADGDNGDLIMIAPPFTITEEQIDDMVKLLARALEKTALELNAARG